MKDKIWGVNRTLRKLAALAAHALILQVMRLEALVSLLRARRIRVLATACWRFPSYSHTFVYRELTEMASRGFEVRFAYSELASRRQLADECSVLWRLKRRLVLSDHGSARDLKYYQQRMPGRVQSLIRAISETSGLTPEAVINHKHFQHAFSFTRMAECWRADYIHSYFFYEGTLFGFVASYLLGIPRGVSCYADHVLQDYDLKLVPLHLRSSDVVVATSARIKGELEALSSRPLANVVVKPNAIDVSQFAAAGSPFSARRTGLYRLTSVSRIHPKKGLTCLAAAAAHLLEWGFDFELTILGEPDAHDPESLAYYGSLQKQIAASGLQETVHLSGWKTSQDVRQILAHTEVFVAPYVELPNGDKDGIPTALLEAMASGCAVVCTDAGSILEVIDDGIEGLIVPQNDAAALAEAIARLMQDDGLRSRLARAAIDRVRRQFDVTCCEEVFHERVRAAIAGRGANVVSTVPTS